MDQSNIDAIYNLLDSIKVTEDNQDIIEEVRENLEDGDYMEALAKLQLLTDKKRKGKQSIIYYGIKTCNGKENLPQALPAHLRLCAGWRKHLRGNRQPAVEDVHPSRCPVLRCGTDTGG